MNLDLFDLDFLIGSVENNIKYLDWMNELDDEPDRKSMEEIEAYAEELKMRLRKMKNEFLKKEQL